jgi:hypothetical protein
MADVRTKVQANLLDLPLI